MKKLWSLFLVLALLLWGAADARSETLADRMAKFPNWESKPTIQAAEGDLAYPFWMAGTWEASSTLVEARAPLAPKIVTPGFENNRKYLNQPVRFLVRFARESAPRQVSLPALSLPLKRRTAGVVADRAYNGNNIARAYLGDRAVIAVKVDPDNPNRQITRLKGDRQLISTITARGSETPAANRFIATEISQQQFQSSSQIYLNEVETTTSYQKILQPTPSIQAEQVTAIYLSPQDPQYFAAIGRPVALYHYHLELIPASEGEGFPEADSV